VPVSKPKDVCGKNEFTASFLPLFIGCSCLSGAAVPAELKAINQAGNLSGSQYRQKDLSESLAIHQKFSMATLHLLVEICSDDSTCCFGPGGCDLGDVDACFR